MLIAFFRMLDMMHGGSIVPAPPNGPACFPPGSRDYYLLTALKEGACLMTEAGIKGEPVAWKREPDVLRR